MIKKFYLKKLIAIILILMIMFTANPVEAAGLKVPKIKKITTTNSSATVTMKKNNSSSSLKIYRSTKKSSGYVLIGSTSKTKFIDKKLSQNKIYYYKIKAYKGKSKQSKFSEPIKVKTKKKSSLINKNTDKNNINTENTDQKNNNINLENQVLVIVNKERAKNNLPPLTMSSKLQEAARARAKEIVKNFSHTRPDGSSCFTILKEYNITYQTCGENIAYGYNSAEKVMAAWMDSPGHRANILKDSFGKIGIGEYNGYWVQLFTN